MPAFRQVGEKQLPNPVLCMAWSPKRDLIALANTTGEVGLKSFIIPETCLGILCSFVIIWLIFGHSCCYTAWLVSSVFGAYHPVSALGKRSLHLPGDLMAKVRNGYISLLIIMLVEGSMKLFIIFNPPLAPQYWPSALETPSRWSCVALRKQRSSTCFQCSILWPACIGWKWQRRTGMCEAHESNQWHKGCLTLKNNVDVWSFDVFQRPQLFLQLRGWIQTFSSQITNTAQEVTSAFITYQVIR